MSWLVTPSTGETFDKCFLGAAPEINPDNMFSGQMATVYLFNEALSAQQVKKKTNIHLVKYNYSWLTLILPRLQTQMLLFKAILLANGVTNSNGKGSIL